jgi:hypothetical protein
VRATARGSRRAIEVVEGWACGDDRSAYVAVHDRRERVEGLDVVDVENLSPGR